MVNFKFGVLKEEDINARRSISFDNDEYLILYKKK